MMLGSCFGSLKVAMVSDAGGGGAFCSYGFLLAFQMFNRGAKLRFRQILLITYL